VRAARARQIRCHGNTVAAAAAACSVALPPGDDVRACVRVSIGRRAGGTMCVRVYSPANTRDGNDDNCLLTAGHLALRRLRRRRRRRLSRLFMNDRLSGMHTI